MSRRMERVAHQLREELARVLREEVTDPRIRLVTLTRVDVAPDLSSAVVYWSTLAEGEEAVEQVREGLESAAAHARACLARALPLRRTPALRFRHDPSLELGSRTLGALRELRDDGET